MIVIPTNNGRNYIYSCVLHLKQHVKHAPITIVDTCSSDLSYREEVKELCAEHGFNFLQCEKAGYDFGAWMLAYQQFPETSWFWFQHDSVYIKHNDFEIDVSGRLATNDMVVLTFFHPSDCFYDNEEQRQFVVNHCGGDQYQNGVYGPNFGITRDALNTMWPDLSKISVTTKIQQQAMERAWAVLAIKHNLKVTHLEQADFNLQLFANDSYKYFDKAKHMGRGPRQ